MFSGQKILFTLALVLIGTNSLYALGWVLADVLVRVDLAVGLGIPEHVRALVPLLPFWQEVIFFSGAGMTATAFILLLQKRLWAIPALLAAIVLLRTDWIILTANNYEGVSWVGFALFVIESAALVCMWPLASQKVLR
jgi:hypothetical protein